MSRESGTMHHAVLLVVFFMKVENDVEQKKPSITVIRIVWNFKFLFWQVCFNVVTLYNILDAFDS